MDKKSFREKVDNSYLACIESSLTKKRIRSKSFNKDIPDEVNLQEPQTTVRTKIIGDDEDYQIDNQSNIKFHQFNIKDITQTETEWLNELHDLFSRRPNGVTSDKIKEVISIDLPFKISHVKTNSEKILIKTRRNELQEGKHHFSKNAVLKYHVNDKDKFMADLEKKFPNSHLAMTFDNIAEVKLEFDKRKRWTSKSEVLKIEGSKVIEAETKCPRSSLFWVVKPPNLIYGSSNNGSIQEDWIKQFLTMGHIETCGPSKILDCFSMSLFAKIQDVTHFYSINEDVISSSLASEFRNINVKYLGINHKLNERIEEEELSFKPDLFFLFGNSLFVFELKCRNEREGEVDNALKCLIYKQYPARLVKYINSHRPEIAKEIKRIVGCGIAYSNATIQTQAFSTNIDQITSYYRCMDFVSAMKQGKRRFKSTGDW